MQTVNGDVLSAFNDGYDVVAHQSNCMGAMGAGLAKQIRNEFPNVYQEYTRLCGRQKSEQLLGKCQLVKINDREDKYIANLFGQLDYGGKKKNTDYQKLRHSLQVLKMNMLYKSLSAVALPYGIGCGLAGGNWEKVKSIIQEELDDTFDVRLYKYNP